MAFLQTYIYNPGVWLSLQAHGHRANLTTLLLSYNKTELMVASHCLVFCPPNQPICMLSCDDGTKPLNPALDTKILKIFYLRLSYRNIWLLLGQHMRFATYTRGVTTPRRKWTCRLPHTRHIWDAMSCCRSVAQGYNRFLRTT